MTTERLLIGPQVKHPTPWTASYIPSQQRWHLVDANSVTVGETDGQEVAQLLVRLVNAAAGHGAAANLFEANALIQEQAGRLAEAEAETEYLRQHVLPEGDEQVSYRAGRKAPHATVYRHGPNDPAEGTLVAVATLASAPDVTGGTIAAALNAKPAPCVDA